jgi:chorismate synthase
MIQRDLDRRKPGLSPYSSPRKEADRAEILSGVTEDGLTNGSPIAILIRNTDARSSDYKAIGDVFRPGHADYSYFKKYGLPPQPGGGRSSGRETVGRVAGGAVARALLGRIGIVVKAGVSSVGPLKAEIKDFDHAENDPLRFLDPGLAEDAHDLVNQVKSQGDSLGGTIELWALGVPPGWGEPVFRKLEALLGKAFFSIGAVRAIEFGEGIYLSESLGSKSNDPIGPDGPIGNLHGGILGGISTGKPIIVRLFVKPTPSISLPQDTIDLKLSPATIKTHGRHDPIIAPRLAPVAEAMCLLVLADLYLERGANIAGYPGKG